MNVIQFLIPKCNLKYLVNTLTVQEAFEKLRACTYTVLPMIDDGGHYVGAVSEKDIINFLEMAELQELERAHKYSIRKVPRHTIINAVSVEINMEKLAAMAKEQDFVPVIDSRGMLVGIVTQKTLSSISTFTFEKKKYYTF